MATISIRRSHTLGQKAARTAARKIAKDLESRFQLACAWEGDEVSFERPGITGRMRVGAREVELDVRLSFLMSPLRHPIEQAIHRELDRLFGAANEA